MTTAIVSVDANTSKVQVNSIDALVVTDTLGTAIKGTTTNNSADAGYVGEYFEARRVQGSALALTSSVTTSITSLSLTAGDWDVQGQVGVITTGTTTVANISAFIDTSVSALGNDKIGVVRENYQNAAINTPGVGNPILNTGVTRISLSAPTTVYLVGYAGFATSTLTMFGAIHARRVR